MSSKTKSNEPLGTFIVLEGIDGSGTTTQAHKLAAILHEEGYDPLVTAEPTRGPVGLLLRRFLIKDIPFGDEEYPPSMMTLLFSADRLFHVSREIEPALKRGEVVICDRYALSTCAYQATEETEVAWIEDVGRHALVPDITVVLLLDPKIGLERVANRDLKREFYENLECQQRVDKNYRQLLLENRPNVVSVNATQSIDAVAEDILAAVRPFLNKSCAHS